MEKVSIIIPVYNGEKVLGRCLDSILNQDYPAFEVILVDDGSRDGSYSLMQEYTKRDTRITAIHKENGGVSSARNRGLDAASGKYIRFADADDWLPMESVKLMVREIEETAADLVIGDFYRVVDNNVSQKGSIEKGGVITCQEYADEMMVRPADLYYGVLWNKLYRKDLIDRDRLRMDENISYSEDMIFNLEYLLHADTIAVLKAPVYYYIHTKGSLVDQNLNLGSTVKMKKSVIRYYSDFYRKTFSPLDYQERIPVIYGYLLAVSRDSLSLPFAPGTKKLGEEAVGYTPFDSILNSDPILSGYLGRQLLFRYLDSVAKKQSIDLNDAEVLYFLWKIGKPCTADQLSSLTGQSRFSATMSLARLLSRGYASRAGRETSDNQKETYVFSCSGLEDDLRQTDLDCASVYYDGLSEEEKICYSDLLGKISANIRKYLLP